MGIHQSDHAPIQAPPCTLRVTQESRYKVKDQYEQESKTRLERDISGGESSARDLSLDLVSHKFRTHAYGETLNDMLMGNRLVGGLDHTSPSHPSPYITRVYRRTRAYIILESQFGSTSLQGHGITQTCSKRVKHYITNSGRVSLGRRRTVPCPAGNQAQASHVQFTMLQHRHRHHEGAGLKPADEPLHAMHDKSSSRCACS